MGWIFGQLLEYLLLIFLLHQRNSDHMPGTHTRILLPDLNLLRTGQIPDGHNDRMIMPPLEWGILCQGTITDRDHIIQIYITQLWPSNLILTSNPHTPQLNSAVVIGQPGDGPVDMYDGCVGLVFGHGWQVGFIDGVEYMAVGQTVGQETEWALVVLDIVRGDIEAYSMKQQSTLITELTITN